MSQEPISFLKELLQAMITRADPCSFGDLPLPQPVGGRTIVVGAGKASAAFAQSFEATASENGLKVDDSLIICPRGSKLPTNVLTLTEAAHPIPDKASFEAASQILAMAQGLGPDDNLIALLSGGGSALMALPRERIGLAGKQDTINALLKSGAPIKAINAIRKHLSQIKGGGLAKAAFPAQVTTLAISDVVGNDPAVIASGPTVGDPTSQADALKALSNFSIPITSDIVAILKDPSNETPGPGDPIFSHCTYHMLCTPDDALAAAEERARELMPDATIHSLGAEIEGLASDVAAKHARQAEALRDEGGSHLILSGGELTVALDGLDEEASPKGGPNHEYALALLANLNDCQGIYVLAADTDGKDGTSDAAGAFIGPQSRKKAKALGLDPESALKVHCSARFFEDLGQNIVTGPTHTNVNDFRAILILN